MNERINNIKSSSNKGQPLKALNVQQREKNPYRYVDENDYEEDLNEEDRTPYINLNRFEQSNRNREVRYEDRVEKILEKFMLKIPSFQGKNYPEAYLSGKRR